MASYYLAFRDPIFLILFSFSSTIVIDSTSLENRTLIEDSMADADLIQWSQRCFQGVPVPLERRCNCSLLWTGRSCSRIVCLHGGVSVGSVCVCGSTGFVGAHCELRTTMTTMCGEAGRKKHPGEAGCKCLGNFFGSRCQFFCWRGTVVLGGRRCKCEHGYFGRSCDRCNPDLSPSCPSTIPYTDHQPPRRPTMTRSRFALSGLSLCLITVMLLWMSVISRRRRALLATRQFVHHQHSIVPRFSTSEATHLTGFNSLHIDRSVPSHPVLSSRPPVIPPSPFYPYPPPAPPPCDSSATDYPSPAPPSYEEALRAARNTKSDG